MRLHRKKKFNMTKGFGSSVKSSGSTDYSKFKAGDAVEHRTFGRRRNSESYSLTEMTVFLKFNLKVSVLNVLWRHLQR